jgi:hypothetical protein
MRIRSTSLLEEPHLRREPAEKSYGRIGLFFTVNQTRRAVSATFGSAALAALDPLALATPVFRKIHLQFVEIFDKCMTKL